LSAAAALLFGQLANLFPHSTLQQSGNSSTMENFNRDCACQQKILLLVTQFVQHSRKPAQTLKAFAIASKD